ncbi:substrate-binding domain-containing protein [Nocardia vinacea]|uniref:Substrate-binding domain-containing protein n=1 Tax=Nocardia vinacea TaxID=96468 RepID=A0ABZ1Z5R3_9NOCA|nr:substrate-binding domain-containing protein [Nocardia vinacea]
MVNTDDRPERERAQITSLRSRQAEGLIIATALLKHPLLQQLHEQRVPMVLVNRRTEELAGGSVAADDAAGIGLAVKHLVELGHRRILHLAGPQTNSTGVERLRAFRTAAREHEALRATCSTPPLTGAPATVLVLMPPGTAAIPTHRAPPTEPVRALPGRRFASADARPRADECSRSPPR